MTSTAEAIGIARSLLIYYGLPFRQRRLRRFYRSFLRAGDLCFDAGAHVGVRTRAMAALGARVIAVEPHPTFAGLLRRFYGGWPEVVVLPVALGAAPARGTLLVSRRAPSVSTLSPSWATAVSAAPGFAGVAWEERQAVPVRTLDELIGEYGMPAFCKLDLEGSEAEALQGLSQPIPWLSFEYTPAALPIALACLKRLGRLGPYEFNWTIGESTRFQSPSWCKEEEIGDRLRALPVAARSGDVYARLRGS